MLLSKLLSHHKPSSVPIQRTYRLNDFVISQPCIHYTTPLRVLFGVTLKRLLEMILTIVFIFHSTHARTRFTS